MSRTGSESAARRHGVVMAVQRDDRRWLMVRRAAGLERAPSMVGFPGGEIEPGETQRQAVAREMREEFDVEAEAVACVLVFDMPDAPWRLHIWITRIVRGELKPNPDEIAEVLWMTPEQGGTHPDALPACRIFFDALAKAGGD